MWMPVAPAVLLAACLPTLCRADPGCVKSSDCRDFCEAGSSSAGIAAGSACFCHDRYKRCTCLQDRAALRADGRCIVSGPEARQNSCKEGELLATLEASVGTIPSPEVQVDHLVEEGPSSAMWTILHWCTSRAMEVDSSRVRVLDATFTPGYINSSQPEDYDPSILFFDLKWSFCTQGVTTLPPGAAFERRFVGEMQGFAAFPRTVLRLLTYSEELPSTAPADAPAHQFRNPPLRGKQDNAIDSPKEADFFMKHILWLGPGAAMSLLIFALACYAFRMRRRKSRTPPAHQGQFLQFWQDNEVRELSQGPGGGSLASVVHAYDPNSEDGTVFATAAGLESFECLRAAEGDLLEVFARGEGWLYGHMSGSGLFGYLPEDCVLWVDTAGMPTHVVDSCSDGTPVQNNSVAEPRTEPEVLGRHPVN